MSEKIKVLVVEPMQEPYPFRPYLRQPLLKRLGLRRWYRLYNTQNTFCICGLDFSLFPVVCNHFNRGTNCTPLQIQLRITAAHFFYVLLDIFTVS